jgi:glycosyltransferase involved in cell wall biosynthesis
MKTLALVPWDISALDGGGKQRCHALLTALPNVTTFALSWENKDKETTLDGMPYRVIPAGAHAMDRAQRLFASGFHSYDVMPTLCRDDLNVLRKAIDDFDPSLLILEHPWLVEFTDGRPYVYDAHNWEAHNTAQLFGTRSLDYELVKDIEKFTISGAEHVTYASQLDWESLAETMHLPAGTHIPNGTHIPDSVTAGKNNNLLFIGSMYQPNVDAAQRLADMADLLPDYQIHLAGASSLAVTTSAPNVIRHGVMHDTQLERLLLSTDVFVNLVTHGSGTHLKLAQALSFGIPCVSTPIGSRGYGDDVITCGLEEVPATIEAVQANWATHSRQARSDAQQFYNWSTIRAQFAETIHALQ